MEDNTKVILTELKDQAQRSEQQSRDQLRAINSLASELRNFGKSVLELATNKNGKGLNGGAWPIATISSVLLGLGVVFTSMATQQSKIGEMQNRHQSQILQLMDGFQQERNTALDTLLQKEVEKEAQIVAEAFGRAELDSQRRHDEQQRQLDEIRGWFLTPKIRESGTFNGSVK